MDGMAHCTSICLQTCIIVSHSGLDVISAQPLFTLITSTLNSADTLERCLDSVAAQTFYCFEHLIVDGASHDSTLAIVERYAQQYPLRLAISKPDTGLYQAWNRGIIQARGLWILFLGSDDYLVNSDVLLSVSQVIIKRELLDKSFVYGQTLSDHYEHNWSSYSGPGFMDYLRGSTPFPGTGSTFISSRLFSQGARFDDSYQICADHKFFALHSFFLNSAYIPLPVTRFSPGGISSNPRNRRLQYIERRKMLREIGLPRPFYTEWYYWVRSYF
jgi:glycosyltransferase involved in cell wall biosynthesis